MYTILLIVLLLFFAAIFISYSNALKEREEEMIRKEYMEFLCMRRHHRRWRR